MTSVKRTSTSKKNTEREEWRLVRYENDEPMPSLCRECGRKLHPTAHVHPSKPPQDIFKCKNGHKMTRRREYLQKELVPKDSDSSSSDDDNDNQHAFRKPHLASVEADRRRQKRQENLKDEKPRTHECFEDTITSRSKSFNYQTSGMNATDRIR